MAKHPSKITVCMTTEHHSVVNRTSLELSFGLSTLNTLFLVSCCSLHVLQYSKFSHFTPTTLYQLQPQRAPTSPGIYEENRIISWLQRLCWSFAANKHFYIFQIWKVIWSEVHSDAQCILNVYSDTSVSSNFQVLNILNLFFRLPKLPYAY